MVGHAGFSTGKQRPEDSNLRASLLIKTCAESQYRFIPMQGSDDRATKRAARSHAVARGLENKRKQQLKLGRNFVVKAPQYNDRRSTGTGNLNSALFNHTCMSFPASPGFFQWLAAESPRLRELLNRGEFVYALAILGL